MWAVNIPFLILVLVSLQSSYQAALELTTSNFEQSIKDSDLVLVNFYAKWCKFSRMLEPVYDETSKFLADIYPDSKQVTLAKVDCEREPDVAKKYNVNKYPTIKMFKNGKIQKREYRGQRSKEAISDYVRKQLESPVQEIKDLDDIQDILDRQKHNILGYFESKDTAEYKQFNKVASMLRDDCAWFSAFGDVSASQRPGGGFQVVYKPPNTEHGEKLYSSSLKSHEMFYSWAHDKCVPLVRVITFENAEELTEEGLPFLILFHHPDDTESPTKFTEVVHKQLIKDKDTINFLTADGIQFAHPLHHMGKNVKDLPVLAIDSFKHMYVYPHKDKMFDSESLLAFIQDLHSGKLHREFHHGPDAVTAPPRQPQEKQSSAEPTAAAGKTDPPAGSDPPESQFVKLAPSDLRYSFKYNDEL